MALPKLDIPTFTITIPSTGKKVKFRPYTVKEQKVLLMAKESDAYIDAMKDLISVCSFNEVDVDKLAPFDIEYIFLQIRANSVGEMIELEFECEKCNAPVPIQVQIGEATVSPEPQRNKRVQLTPDVGIVLKYPTINVVGKQDDITSILIECIDTIYDSESVYDPAEQTEDELVEFVESIPSTKLQEIAEFVNGMPRVVMDVAYKCHACKHVTQKHLEGLETFF